ncbi:MAG: OmpH family outer membrane protein [Chitinophagaceae bacterium]|nr:OmpH family outer membrane protein [Chitinophagaceae bacterium]
MKKFFVIAVLATGLLIAAKPVTAQSKIGYISTEELISVMPETVKADSNLQQFRNALIQNAQEKQNTLESAIEKFNKDSATMTQARKDVQRTELQKMLQELQGEEQRIQQQLQQKQQELIGPINKKAFDAIQAVAKENGYGYVFEKNALLVAPPGEDIIQLVAKKLLIKLPNQTTTTPPTTAPKLPVKQ